MELGVSMVGRAWASIPTQAKLTPVVHDAQCSTFVNVLEKSARHRAYSSVDRDLIITRVEQKREIFQYQAPQPNSGGEHLVISVKNCSRRVATLPGGQEHRKHRIRKGCHRPRQPHQ